MDIARYKFCDIKFGHLITDAMGSFDYKIHNSIQIIFHLVHKWSKCIVSEFSEIMLHKCYFCKSHTIKRKGDNGISIADKADILIPLSCSKASICKHYYQESHPYSDVEEEYYSYHRPLNNAGMGQNRQDLQCLCSEDVTVLHLATGIFQERHIHYHSHAIHSHCAGLRYCSYHYMPIT